MRESRGLVDRFLRAVGIAEGAYFLWFTLSGGVLVIGAASGLLAIYGNLPWWSVALIVIGLLGLTIGVLNRLASIVSSRMTPQSRSYHALTSVIEEGRRLRKRLSELERDPDEQEQEAWRTRLGDWQKNADAVVAEVAPFRLAAYRADPVYAGWSAPKERTFVVNSEMELELRLERLLYLRVTL